MQRKRPFVLWVIITAQLVQFLTVAALFGVLYLTDIPIPPQILPNDELLLINISVSTALAFFSIIGLYQMARWGWIVLMLRLGLDLCTTIWGYFFSASPNYFGMLAAVATVFYLNLNSVRALFLPQSERTT